MSGLLAAEGETALVHALQHVPVADGGLFDTDAVIGHRAMQAEVAHDRGDESVVGELPTVFERDGEDSHDLIAVDDLAGSVHGKAPVGVAVVRDAEVGAVRDDSCRKLVEVCRADAVVDVQSVGIGADDRHACAGIRERLR